MDSVFIPLHGPRPWSIVKKGVRKLIGFLALESKGIKRKVNPIMRMEHRQVLIFTIGVILLFCTPCAVRSLTFNGPNEARLWLPILWAVCGLAVLIIIRLEPISETTPRRRLSLAAKPTTVELIIASIWIGSYLILGSNATYPRVFTSPGTTKSLMLILTAFVYYGFPWILLLWFAIRVALLSRTPLLSLSRRHWHRWVLAIVIGVVISLQWTNADLILRVYLSEEELQSHVRDHIRMAKGPPSQVNTHYVRLDEKGDLYSSLAFPHGLFTVYSTSVKGDVVWLTTVRFGPPFTAGLCYCENGPPPRIGESTYQHLYGPWWRWLCDT